MSRTATSDVIASTSASAPPMDGRVTARNEAQSRAADAAVDTACRAVARRIWSSSPEYLDAEVAEEIRASAVAFVVARREELPPEQVLASLKFAFNEALLRHGDTRDQQAVRGLLLAAFLRGYYGDGQRR